MNWKKINIPCLVRLAPGKSGSKNFINESVFLACIHLKLFCRLRCMKKKINICLLLGKVGKRIKSYNLPKTEFLLWIGRQQSILPFVKQNNLKLCQLDSATFLDVNFEMLVIEEKKNSASKKIFFCGNQSDLNTNTRFCHSIICLEMFSYQKAWQRFLFFFWA